MTDACLTEVDQTRAGSLEELEREIKPKRSVMNSELSHQGKLESSYFSSQSRTQVTCRPCCSVCRPPASESASKISAIKSLWFTQIKWRLNLPINEIKDLTEENLLKKTKTLTSKVPLSHIRFWAVQLRQCRCFEKPLPLAQRQSAALAQARGSTGQGLRTDGQLPGCIWSVCSRKNDFLTLSAHGTMSITHMPYTSHMWAYGRWERAKMTS